MHQMQMNTDRRAMEFALDRCRELERGLAFEFEQREKTDAENRELARQLENVQRQLEGLARVAAKGGLGDMTNQGSPGPHPMEVTGHDCTDKPDRAMPTQPPILINTDMLEHAFTLLCNVDDHLSARWQMGFDRFKERYHRAKE